MTPAEREVEQVRLIREYLASYRPAKPSKAYVFVPPQVTRWSEKPPIVVRYDERVA